MIRDLSDALMARGHSVQLITSHAARPTRTTEDGLEVVRQWRPPEPARLRLPPGSSAAPGAWWALRRGDADIAQGWTIPAALAAARSGKPSAFVFQGVLDEADLEGRPRVRSMLLRAARECDAVVTYSEVAAEAFTRIAGVEAGAIEPGIRLDAFTPGEAPVNAGPKIFCAADPTEPRKRVRLLLDAFALVHDQKPDAELLLMQKGSDPPFTKLLPGVRLVDPGSDRDALVGLYREATVTCLPAFREAFGLVVVESLACGTPVVGTTDGGAVPAIIGSDAVAGPDPGSLAALLLRALDSPADAGACRRIAERYSIERCAERFEALYRELL